MIKRDDAILAVIDVQQRLIPVIDCGDDVCVAIERLVKGMNVLGVPILLTEQYPAALGRTVETLNCTITSKAIEKISFSCCGSVEFDSALCDADRPHVIVAGVETHVCVYQTVRDLLDEAYDVSVVVDAVGSRSPSDKEIAIRRIEALGASLTSVEMILFDLLESADDESFKKILRIVK